jgi:hypothetical protein
MAEHKGVLTWANSATSGTAATGTGVLGAVYAADQVLGARFDSALVHVHNPSAVSALTIQPRIRWLDSGDVERTSDIGSALAVPISSTLTFEVTGGLGAGRIDILATNDTTLGPSDGFSAEIVVDTHLE